MTSDRHKPRKPIRQPANLLDKAEVALQQLIELKTAERASGRFGIIVVLDRGNHTGIREVIDRALYVD